MLRNLEHRVEATCPVWHPEALKQELIDILNIQLEDNVKARKLDNELSNEYVRTEKKKYGRRWKHINSCKKKTDPN
jgi:polyphosphate kinase